MNLNELKPLWESYKENIERQSHWDEAELSALLQENPKPNAWHKKSRLAMLNLCMSLLLIGMSGC